MLQKRLPVFALLFLFIIVNSICISALSGAIGNSKMILYPEVDGETITILTDAAEHAEEIDAERAEAAHKAAKELMEKKRDGEEGYTEAMAELERSLSRIKIVRKRRRGSKVRIQSN